MKTTALYVRVSTDRQAQAQTIQQQVERLQTYLTSEGQTLTEDEIFRDDGYSGASLNRPGLDQLRDRISRGCFERVLITSPDRLSRRFVHQMLIIEEFERASCEIQFLDRPMSQDPHDQLLLQIRGAVAEYERVLIAERMRRGRQLRLRSGTLLPWTIPPYGYRSAPDCPRDPAAVRIEPTEGVLVQELFVRYLEPLGTLLGLAKYLLELQVPSPRGNPRWSAASLRGVLTNPAYTGKLCVGRRRSRPPRTRRSATHGIGKPARGADFTPRDEWSLVGFIPALVTEDIFDRVQQKLASNMKQAARNNKSHPYLLRALVSCGACQSACISRTTNGGRSYYACRCLAQPLYSGHDKRCRSRYIPADQLDTIVWHDLVEIISEPEAIVNALQRAHQGHWLPQQQQARREALRKAQATLRQQVERLTEAYLAGIVQLSEYQRRRHELDTRHAGLEQQFKELSAQVDRQKEISDMAASIQDFCQRIQTGLTNASFARKRILMELLVDRVLVNNDQVEIRYVIPTHARAETTRFCHLRKDYFHDIVQVLTRSNLDRILPAIVELVVHAHTT